MSLDLLIPILSSMLGRDLSREYALFKRSGLALGRTMNDDGKAFFGKNWPSIVDFMETPEGQDALKMFLELWAEWLAKKAITAQEEQAQSAQEPQEQFKDEQKPESEVKE